MKIKVTFESKCDNCGKKETLSWNHGERNPKDTDPYIHTTYLDFWGNGLPENWIVVSYPSDDTQELFCSEECWYTQHPEMRDAIAVA